MRKLMTVDTHDLCRPSGTLAGHDGWVAAFERAGAALASLANRGALTRGLRAVIAHHVIFHSNRAGLPRGGPERCVQHRTRGSHGNE
jgi:protein-L-isoaspartate(D-aspartate) O-methyltransferase